MCGQGIKRVVEVQCKFVLIESQENAHFGNRMSKWKQFRYRLERVGVELLRRSVPMLPRMWAVGLARALGKAAWRLDARSRAVALANLEAAFGDRYTPAEREEIAQASFENFARTMVDLFWAPAMADAPERYFVREGLEAAGRRHRENRGTIYFTSHTGNWEWMSLAFGYEGLSSMVVAQEFKNPALTAVFRAMREVTGHQIIDQDRSMFRIFRHVKKGGSTGFLVDLSLPPSQPTAIIECFGLKTCATLLHVLLHEKTGIPLTPTTSYSRPDGTCLVRAGEPMEFPPEASRAEKAQLCWNVFEEVIRNHPELWLWSYKQWRYRPREGGEKYPFYANVSKAFDRKMREQAES